MPTMLKRLLHIAFFLALTGTANGQYLQGKLQGGSGVPGTTNRSPLNSLERAANNLEGVTIVSDTFGNQRLAYYVRVLDSCVNYNPLTYVGTMPPSCFVYQCGSQDSLFYIDWKGDAVFVGTGGACDEYWLEISDNTCPDAITDSIYHYKYAAIGARLVWPTAEFLVNDSLNAVVQILAGDRNARLGFYDNQNQVYSTIDQSGTSTIWYFNPTGEMRWVTAGSGTPQSPGAPFVNQFAIDPNDSPFPTVQAYLYPNTRTDTNTVENFIYTDPVGKFRSRPIDSLIQIVSDSILLDSLLQANWYTTNGTTSDNLRVAQVKRSAWWRANGADADSVGFIRHQFGIASGSRSNLNKDSAAIYFNGDNANLSYFSAKRDSVIMFFSPYDMEEEKNYAHSIVGDVSGFTIRTDGAGPRSVGFYTDTMNWFGNFDSGLFSVNLLSDATYFFADSTKKVAIGQFPDFPNLNFGLSERGIFYDPDVYGLVFIASDGSTTQTYENLAPSEYFVYLTELPDYLNNGFSATASSFKLNYVYDFNRNFIDLSGGITPLSTKISIRSQLTDFFSDTSSVFQVHSAKNSGRDNRYAAMGDSPTSVSKIKAISYIGRSPVDASDILARSDNLAFGVQQNIPGGDWFFDHLKIDLNSDDTTLNTVSLYGRSYYFANERPSTIVGDTSFHFWAGNGTNTNPGFITLAQIQSGSQNIYNYDGTTTDNTRIADILETITFRSEDVTVDGVFPFRFELNGSPVNEPEMMVWKFPTDSLMLAQADQEIFFRSTNQLLLWADEKISFWADSLFYLNNGVEALSITKYNQITQRSVSAGIKKDYIANRTITGTAQTELFLDGSAAVLTLPANSNNNFEIHISAICSSAGNGVGISAGDSFGCWYLGNIKRVVNTTTLVGISTPVTAQADASMNTAVVAIDANDTNDSLRIRFTPPFTAGSTTVIKVMATIKLSQISY